MISSPSYKSLMLPQEDSAETEDMDITVEGGEESDPEVQVMLTPDGGAILVVDTQQEDESSFDSLPHNHNLAEILTRETAYSLSCDLMDLVQGDIVARKDWEHLQEEGMRLLSLKVEEKDEPWPGASAAKHPVLMDAMIRYQSDTIREVLPPTGPAETFVFGKQTPEQLALANRIKTELNYQIFKMDSFKPSLEQTLLSNAYSGAAYRKWRYNSLWRRPEGKFVPATDLIIEYGAASIHDATRYTHRQRLNHTQWEFMEESEGWISDPDPCAMPRKSVTDEINEEGSGTTQNYLENSIEVYEIYTFLSCPELFGGEEPEVPAPFIVVIDTETQTIRSIRRNWSEGDETRTPLIWFSEFSYIPSPWGMPLGLIHIIGGLTDAGTSLLRQMIDAGTLSNVPSGFKSRGLKIARPDEPIEPGEFRDVDMYDGTKVSDQITFLPTRGVDSTSFQLLQSITEEARKAASAADIKASDASAAATGAMMAVLERATSVMSAVQSRAADAIATELKILQRIIADNMPGPYEYETEDGPHDRGVDFNQAVGIKSVADPSASTQAMRILRNQAITAQASQNPDLYDQTELHRRVMRDLGVEDVNSLIPRAGEAPQRDPVSENQALLMGQSVKAYMEQDHAAHLAVHMAAMENPGIQAFVGQSQNGPKIIAAAQAHLAEHMAFAYRQEIEKSLGAALPPPGEPLPADVENQIARLVAQTKIPPIGQPPQQSEPQPDPIVVLQQQELQLKQAELELKKANLELAAQKQRSADEAEKLRAQIALAQDETRRETAALNAQVEQLRIMVDKANNDANRQVQLAVEAEKIIQTDRIEGTKAGIQAAKVQQAVKSLEQKSKDAPKSEG